MNERKTLKLGIIYNSLGNQHKLYEKQVLVDRNYVVVVAITNCFIDNKNRFGKVWSVRFSYDE